MASGFVTNDGKDLDSRYLGINAKAASAKTADNVTNKGSAKRGSVVYFTASRASPYTAAANGVVAGRNVACNVNTTDSTKCSNAAYVNKGDKVYLDLDSTTQGALFPVSIS